jgi:ClpP class serine protease
MFARPWLIPQASLDALVSWCERSPLTDAALTDERVAMFIERRSSGRAGGEVFLKDGTGAARIPILGTLTKEPDIFLSLFGGGSSIYGDIIEAIQAADIDPDVNRIVLEIDSLGGDVDGFFEVAAAIRATGTRIEAEVTDNALSAAFGLAAQADQITVNNPMATVGSVGVVARRLVDDQIIRVTSTEAPLKAPDASTPEGVKAIRAELDDIHAEFVTIIAQGRSAATGNEVTEDDVNENFGRGASVIARDALAAGMIDAIGSASTEPATGANPATNTGASAMDLATLRAEHPALCAALIAEGHTAGVTSERDRVTAHVTAGNACGNLGLAAEMIADGSEFTSQNVQARYMTANRDAADAGNRAADDAGADTGSGADAVEAKAKADTEAKATANGEQPDEFTNSVFKIVNAHARA